MKTPNNLNIRLNYILVFIFSGLLAISQSKRPLDSLIRAYEKLSSDTDRFDNLMIQVKIYRLGEPEKAMQVSQKMYELSKKINTNAYKARACFNLAVEYRKAGDYDSSIVLYMKALQLFEGLKDEPQVAGCYGSLGIMYWQQKEYEPAIRYLRRSLEITQKLGRRANECSNLNNIGGVYFDMKRYDSSLAYLHKSLAISEEMKDTAGLADAYGNMGAVYILLKDTTNANKYSVMGINYSKLSGNNYQLFTSYNNIAQAMLMGKHYKEAERYSLMSLEVSEQLGAMEGSRGNYKALAELYKETGQPEKANIYLEKFIAINDSLISEARMKQMTGLEAKYESAKKDKELLEERSASERKSTLLYALIIGLLLLALLAVFVYRSYRNKKKFLGEMTLAKREIEIKSLELESRNKDVTDSINYAKKIQNAVLPHEETIYKSIPGSFILYKPKDIVSGDFFWFHEIDADNYILVCGDCTGHGVPGALMTVIGSDLLNRVVVDNRIHEPAKILYEMDRLLNITLKQDKEQFNGVQDGMDLSLLRVNKTKKELIASTAKRPFVVVKDKQLRDYKGGKNSLGGMKSGEKLFEEIKLEYSDGDMLYFFTDGYIDQFGGDKGKKFSSKKLKELFLTISDESTSVQKEILEKEIVSWKGSLEQVDDICIIGIRF